MRLSGPDKFTARGYWVCDHCRQVERDVIELRRSRAGRWSDPNHTQVVFHESEDLPAEDWLVAPTSRFDKGRKLEIRGVAVVWNDDKAFVLDPASADELQQLDPDAIEWLPVPEKYQEEVAE